MRTLSAAVRRFRSLPQLRHGHIADRRGYSPDTYGSLASSAAIPIVWEQRSVKPSAQPTLVRTQHLPPHITPVQAVYGEIIAAGRRAASQSGQGLR